MWFHVKIYIPGIHDWDFDAGDVLTYAAGGVVQDPGGQEFDMMNWRILVAATPKLVQDWHDKVDFKYLKKRRVFQTFVPQGLPRQNV